MDGTQTSFQRVAALCCGVSMVLCATSVANARVPGTPPVTGSDSVDATGVGSAAGSAVDPTIPAQPQANGRNLPATDVRTAEANEVSTAGQATDPSATGTTTQPAANQTQPASQVPPSSTHATGKIRPSATPCPRAPAPVVSTQPTSTSTSTTYPQGQVPFHLTTRERIRADPQLNKRYTSYTVLQVIGGILTGVGGLTLLGAARRGAVETEEVSPTGLYVLGGLSLAAGVGMIAGGAVGKSKIDKQVKAQPFVGRHGAGLSMHVQF